MPTYHCIICSCLVDDKSGICLVCIELESLNVRWEITNTRDQLRNSTGFDFLEGIE